MSQPIHHTFAPLGDRKQRMTALRFSYFPWKYKRGPETEHLRSALGKKFQADAFLFGSGREGFLALLRSIKGSEHDEVIVPGYTCVVLPNAIHAAGMKTVYADIEKSTLGLTVETVRDVLTPHTRAIVCQHTFGIPSDVVELRKLCDERGILLIEDCAHSIPDDDGPGDMAMKGDFVLLSFGRDKAISGIAGGAMLSRVPDVSQKLLEEEARAHDLPFWTVMRLMEYPQIYALGRSLYGFLKIGKAYLWLMGKTKMLIPSLTRAEKSGEVARELYRIPNVCAALALEELNRLYEINAHRRILTQFYLKACAEHGWPVLHGISASLPLQKFPLIVPNAKKLLGILKQQNINLDDGWSGGCIVCPPSTDMSKMGYTQGSDPVAESLCGGILNLPTHPGMTLEQAKKLVSTLQRFL